MRKALALIAFVVLVTAGVSLIRSTKTEETFIYYLNSEQQAQTATPPPAPSSIYCLLEGQRLSLEYIAKHKHYTISPPFTHSKSHTKVSLLLELVDLTAEGAPANVSATIVDDLGQQYQLIRPAEVETIDAHTWRYILLFPPLNPQARNVTIYVETGDSLFELIGATIP
ncbi:MAG TPA: hypothetical protein GX738_07245 [Firmicutes bacterium]|nr:hypothetical protein [Bacillota bacterium]